MNLEMTLANETGSPGLLSEISPLLRISYDKFVFAETLLCNINPGRTILSDTEVCSTFNSGIFSVF